VYNYPVKLKKLNNGDIMVNFRDVPEAITCGDTEELALELAQDALHVALSMYVDKHLNIPNPSKPRTGQHTVSPAPMVGVKLTLHQAMNEQGISQARLASLLHCDARQVRRLLDLDHQSTVKQLLDAAEVLGFNLDFTIQPKPRRTESSVR
jgi:antitoxin HicB